MTTVRGLFDEPLDAPAVIAMLVTDERRFFMAAYVLLRTPERWRAALDQVGRLFIECMREQIPDKKLYEIAALMFVWAGRFSDRGIVAVLRHEMMAALNFVDQDRMRKLVLAAQPKPPRRDEQMWRGQI
jgi:hypothetical protein